MYEDPPTDSVANLKKKRVPLAKWDYDPLLTTITNSIITQNDAHELKDHSPGQM